MSDEIKSGKDVIDEFFDSTCASSEWLLPDVFANSTDDFSGTKYRPDAKDITLTSGQYDQMKNQGNSEYGSDRFRKFNRFVSHNYEPEPLPR